MTTCGVTYAHLAHRGCAGVDAAPFHNEVLCDVTDCPLWHAAPAVAWCSKCEQPATGDDELCDMHRRTPNVPDAITDPWLRGQYQRTVRTGGVR